MAYLVKYIPYFHCCLRHCTLSQQPKFQFYLLKSILEMFYVYITAPVTDALPVCIHLLVLLSGGGPGLMLQFIRLQPKSLFTTKDINKAG